MESTERLSMPMILAGQAQKEIFHNEALQILDVIVAGAVEEEPRTSAPTSPAVGHCYIVAEAAAGEWQGRDGQVAAYTAAGWRYISPVEGMMLRVRASGEMACYFNSGWEVGVLRGSGLSIGGSQVVGSQAGAISEPAGGAQVDAEARSAVAAILGALRQHGLIAT